MRAIRALVEVLFFVHFHPYGIRNLDDNMYHYLDYIPQWKYIASDVGDVIFVKPLVECIIGVDLITGEELDGYERGMKLVVAAVDLSGVGLAAKAGAGLGQGESRKS